MKSLKISLILLVGIALSECKSPTAVMQEENVSLLSAYTALDNADQQFHTYYDQSHNDKLAVMQTAAWLRTQPNVSSADPLDSVNIYIHMKDGLTTVLSVVELDANGFATTRGGRSPGALAAFATHATHEIKNKKVLIYAPAFSEFYTDAEMQAVVDSFEQAGIGIEVTVLKNSKATVDALYHLKDYGVVILDTHGHPDSFLAGNEILISGKPATEAEIAAILDQQIGAGTATQMKHNAVLFGSLITVSAQQQISIEHYPLVSTNFISTLPTMESTLLFGNMCYSGWMAHKTQHLSDTNYFIVDKPIQPTFMGLNPIAYYCYVDDVPPGTATVVENEFAKANERHFASRLAKRQDSTGIANLKEDNTTEYSELKNQQYHITQFWRRFGAVDYNYVGCVDTFTDERDGHLYHAVCIGSQTWMAENLDYAAPGSLCYDNDGSNCVIYGRLYDWATVMQGASSSSMNPSGVRGICPKGWHVPSQAEFALLVQTLGGAATAGAALKDTSIWTVDPNLPAHSTNSSGFSAIPAGFALQQGAHFQEKGTGAIFWSATESPAPNHVYDLQMDYQQPSVGEGQGTNTVIPKDYLTSCRCLEDK